MPGPRIFCKCTILILLNTEGHSYEEDSMPFCFFWKNCHSFSKRRDQPNLEACGLGELASPCCFLLSWACLKWQWKENYILSVVYISLNTKKSKLLDSSRTCPVLQVCTTSIVKSSTLDLMLGTLAYRRCHLTQITTMMKAHDSLCKLLQQCANQFLQRSDLNNSRIRKYVKITSR
jgi:hypothetical protein